MIEWNLEGNYCVNIFLDILRTKDKNSFQRKKIVLYCVHKMITTMQTLHKFLHPFFKGKFKTRQFLAEPDPSKTRIVNCSWLMRQYKTSNYPTNAARFSETATQSHRFSLTRPPYFSNWIMCDLLLVWWCIILSTAAAHPTLVARIIATNVHIRAF